MSRRTFFILLIIGAIAFWQYRNGSLSSFFDNQPGQQELEEQEELEPDSPSYEKSQLMDLIESQADLIEEIKDARDSGNKDAVKDSYEEILRLDKEYQELYKTVENELSNSERNEISRKHYNVMQSLPN